MSQSDRTPVDGPRDDDTDEEDPYPHPWRLVYENIANEGRVVDTFTEEEESEMREDFEHLVVKQSKHRNKVHLLHPDVDGYPLCGRVEQKCLDDPTDGLLTKPFGNWPSGWFASSGGDTVCSYCLEVWRQGVYLEDYEDG